MDNQHRKISGYRELNQEEIDLMNEIKEKGRELNQLVGRVMLMHVHETSAGIERGRLAEYAGMNIETGVMQLVRVVALPATGVMQLVRAVALPE